jgi:hypothetical protein
MANLRIVDVYIMKNCSSFETDAGQAAPLIEAFKKVKFRKRQVLMELDDQRGRKGKDTQRPSPRRKPGSRAF